MTRPFVASQAAALDWYRRDARPSEWALVLESISQNIVLHHGWGEKLRRRLFVDLDETLFELLYSKVSQIPRAGTNTDQFVDFNTETQILVDVIDSKEFRELKALRRASPSDKEPPLESFERILGKFCSIAQEIQVIDTYLFQDWIKSPHSATSQILKFLGERSLKTILHGVDPTLLRDSSVSQGQRDKLMTNLNRMNVTFHFYHPKIDGKGGREPTKFPHPRLMRFGFDGGNPVVVQLDQGLETFSRGNVNSVVDLEDPLTLWRSASKAMKVTAISQH